MIRKHFNPIAILSIIILITAISPLIAQEKMNEMWGNQQVKKADTINKRGKLFEWGNYAMFIHWGLFSHLGNIWDGKTYYGIGEWLMNVNMANANRDEYKAVSHSFNPQKFDAMKVAQLAKAAGMKYIIITSKHHDGFAMYHSSCNKFNIVDATPFTRDPMKELSEACKKTGLGFGFYYSHNQDWTTPGASGAPKVDKDGNPRTFNDYFHKKCLPQVEEITKNYGDMELIWFDTPGNIPKKYAEKLVEVVRKNQPHALISGRIGYNLGDYQTLGDMEVPLENVEGMWESVDVTNEVWGYAWYDQNWKSPRQILKNLISTIARGGTYMLNIGLDGMGEIPEFASQALQSSGKWIARYPQVIYGTEPSPWKHALPWGDVIKHDQKLYLNIYEWPESGKLYLPGLKTQISSASLLEGNKKRKISFQTKNNWTIFQIPFRKPDPLISVIELVLKDDVIVDNTQALDPEIGSKELSVLFAETTNCHIRKSSWMEKFGEWKHVYCVRDLGSDSKISWIFNVKVPGVYHVDLKVRGTKRTVWKVETDEGHSVQNQQSTSSIFCDRPIGWIRFDKPGRHTVSINMPEGGQADLAAISLTPVTF